MLLVRNIVRSRRRCKYHETEAGRATEKGALHKPAELLYQGATDLPCFVTSASYEFSLFGDAYIEQVLYWPTLIRYSHIIAYGDYTRVPLSNRASLARTLSALLPSELAWISLCNMLSQ